MNKYRSHNCSELSEKEIDKNVILSGWLHRKRDHGNLLFIDLRDHYGITQCVIETKNDFFPILEKSKSISTISFLFNTAGVFALLTFLVFIALTMLYLPVTLVTMPTNYS